jgi:hypothetical protein
MTFRARHRRIAVALIQAIVAALDVLSQLVPGASHLVVVMLPLTVLLLATAGSLIHDDAERSTASSVAPVFVITRPHHPDWADTEADADTFAVESISADRAGNPHGSTVIELPSLAGAAVFCPPRSPRRARRRSRPLTAPSLACLTGSRAGRRIEPKPASSLFCREVWRDQGQLRAG